MPKKLSPFGKLLSLEKTVNYLRIKHLDSSNKNKYFDAWQKAAKKYYELKEQILSSQNNQNDRNLRTNY
jgi:hypothetical protein